MLLQNSNQPRASFSLNRYLHYESQIRQFFLAGPGRVWHPDANQDSNDWKGAQTKCSTSKMRISPSAQEVALRNSGKKHRFSLTKNLFCLKLCGGGSTKYSEEICLWLYQSSNKASGSWKTSPNHYQPLPDSCQARFSVLFQGFSLGLCYYSKTRLHPFLNPVQLLAGVRLALQKKDWKWMVLR